MTGSRILEQRLRGRADCGHDYRVTGADKRPGILALLVGSWLQKARELAGLSYDEAAARTGCEAEWLIRVETGFTAAGAGAAERILTAYGLREALTSDKVIDMARRAAAPPPWLAAHAPGMKADLRDVLLVEAEATLAQVHGITLVPELAQTEAYFRAMAPGVYPGRDADREWDLLSLRQGHQPAGVTRLLDFIIDEGALDRLPGHPEVMAGQLRRLLELDGSPHAAVRVIPAEAPLWEDRAHNFAILSFAGTSDRVGVSHTVVGPMIAHGDLHELWTDIAEHSAASPERSRAVLEHRLAAVS
jgi:transcriptional regulator with XRE-family HTH domain